MVTGLNCRPIGVPPGPVPVPLIDSVARSRRDRIEEHRAEQPGAGGARWHPTIAKS